MDDSIKSLKKNSETADRTRTALLEAAFIEFATHGYQNASTSRIVEMANVTRGALYYHFKDKLDLFDALYEKLNADMVARLERDVDHLPDAWERVEKGTEIYFSLFAKKDLTRITLKDAPSILGWQRYREVMDKYASRRLVGIVEGLINDKLLPPLNPRSLSALIGGAMNRACMLIAESNTPEVTRIEMTRSFLAMIAAMRVR